MKEPQDQPTAPVLLSRDAEQGLARTLSKRGEQRIDVELERLVHELEVHQIELKMQNEELQQTRATAEALLAQYTALYDFAPVGYFTLAGDGTILAVNLTGARLVGVERARLLNRRLGLLFAGADWPTFDTFIGRAFTEKGPIFCELSLPRAGAASRFVRIETTGTDGQQECYAAVLDVTDRHRVEVEREHLIQDLHATLARVKTLSGLLPICANCKKIRDDQGYWKQVEVYVGNHSEATFSHGICPDCFKKLYPELGSPIPETASPERVGQPRCTV